jgi:hypothetical protein
VVNDKVLYKIGRIKISGCQWTPQESRNIQIDILQKLKKEFVLEKVQVLFRNDELICEGELVLPNNDRVSVFGNCAVADTSSFAKVNGKRPTVGEDPIFVAFDFLGATSSIGKAISDTKGIGPESHLIIEASIPLNLKGSDYLSYMLSNEAIDACDSLTSNKKR